MSLEGQVDADFSRARRKAILRRAMAHLRRDPTFERLPCFEETRRRLGAVGGVHRGLRVVRSNVVVGSVGRCSEFDEAFLPARASTEKRWKRIDRAFHRAEEFPPVSLYKLGDAYFVLDGNHRVSVYRYHGVEWIDAEVTEFRAPLPQSRRGGNKPDRADQERGRTEVYEMLDPQLPKQLREDMLREAEMNRQTKALRAARKRHSGAGRRSALAWELKRYAGRLSKLLRVLKKTSW
jgi:hypothetical protein